jgi:hypothetical protein
MIERERMRIEFWWENLSENVHFTDWEGYGRIILRMTISEGNR